MQFIRLGYKCFIFIFLAAVIVIIGLYTHAYFSEPIKLNSVGTYYLYDKDETLVYQGSSVNEWISIDQVSDYLIDAVISVEDKNFYKHTGFDYLRIARAMLKNITSGKIMEGASTISQQYIKNAYLEFDKTWSRKFKEAFMTLNLEVHYSKDEILEAYLNTINYGQGNYGISSAAKFYFNKLPSELTLEESLILAGIPKSPNNYNPVTDYEASIKRAKIVALTMYNNELIDKDTYNSLFQNQINIHGKRSENDLQMLMYYHDAVISELKNIDHISEDMLNSGSLKVYTTLDYNAQKTLEENILKNLNDPKLQTAGIIIDPKDGSILALTGGIDYAKSQYNRALYSKRQVGSTMKPFLYYAALNNGMTSSSTFLSQYTTFNLSNGKTYSPKNYSNIYGNKNITMAAAIAYSDNIYAVKTNLFLGVDELINTAHLCGIDAELQEVPSLALGTSEINLLDFADGYTTFASGGYKRNIHFITKVEDKDGNILYQAKDKNDLVLNPNYVYILNELMTSTTNTAFIDYNSPTALNIASKLTQKYAFKTGTTDTDYWAVGYNKDILMVTWTGYDDNSGLPLTAAMQAKNAWAETIEKVYDIENGNHWYEKPSNVVGVPLNAVDGQVTNDTNKVNMFYYLRGSEPVGAYSNNQEKTET
ncbi:MAG: penicillin-binding protein [Bacilli bacterium]|nr:penicillin-binding protein [Bacilli bacterium]